jgi:hypothetical protein
MKKAPSNSTSVWLLFKHSSSKFHKLVSFSSVSKTSGFKHNNCRIEVIQNNLQHRNTFLNDRKWNRNDMVFKGQKLNKKRAYLFSMLTAITIIDTCWIQTKFLITRFPLFLPIVIHQILNTIDERKMCILQKGMNHRNKILITLIQIAKHCYNQPIKLRNINLQH